MRLLSAGMVAAALTCATSAAQICLPVDGTDPVYPFPMVGQSSAAGVRPVCANLVPPPVLFVAGNPALTISTVSPPPATAGSPTALVFFPALGPPLPAPPLVPWCGYTPYPTGFPETPLIPTLALGVRFLTIPGPPAPGGPVRLPVPPGIPPGRIGFIVMTVGIDGGSAGRCVYVTDGIRFGT